MSFNLDELLQKTKEVVVAAGKVAGDVVVEVVDTSKSKLNEAKITAAIRELNERLGNVVYSAAKTGRESLKLQEMLIAELEGLYKSLEELRSRNAAAAAPTSEIVCAGCGEHNPRTAVYCLHCGTRLIPSENDYAVETEIREPVTSGEAAEELVAKAEAMTEAVEDIVDSIAEDLEDLK